MSLSTFNGLSSKDLKRLECSYRKMGELINELSYAYNPEKIIALKRLYHKLDFRQVFDTLRKVVRD